MFMKSRFSSSVFYACRPPPLPTCFWSFHLTHSLSQQEVPALFPVIGPLSISDEPLRIWLPHYQKLLQALSGPEATLQPQSSPGRIIGTQIVIEYLIPQLQIKLLEMIKGSRGLLPVWRQLSRELKDHKRKYSFPLIPSKPLYFAWLHFLFTLS